MMGRMDQLPELLFIAGEWREANDGARFDVEDPADGSTIAKVADAGEVDAADALDAAVAAQAAVGGDRPPRARRAAAYGVRAHHRAQGRLRRR